MYVLKRVAVRALAQRPSRQLSILRSSSRVTHHPAVAIRSFHQTRIWRSDEESKKGDEASPAEATTSGETVATKSSATEEAEKPVVAEESTAGSEVVEDAQSAPQTSASQDAVSESSGTTSEPLGQPEAESSEAKSAVEQAQKSASGAAETASTVAEKVQKTASSAAGAVKDALSDIAPAASDAAAAASQALPRRRDAGQTANPPNKILYIGNLFFEVTADDLEGEFSRLGEITNSRIVTDSRGLSKGFGYIEFADQKTADKAVQTMDQKVFQGRRMAVQYHLPKESRPSYSNQNMRGNSPPSKTLFIGNLSYQMSDRDLNDLFRQVKNVLDVRVAIDRRSGQPRGFAHADFVDEPAATAAKEILEKKVIYGRQLKIDYSASSSTTQI